MKNNSYKTATLRNKYRQIKYVCIIVAVLLASTYPAALASAQPRGMQNYSSASTACSDIIVLGARGSGGSQSGSNADNYTGVSEQVYGLYSKINARVLKNNKTIQLEAVEYPALPVESLLVSVSEFEKSIRQGADDIVNKTKLFQQKCPSTDIILIGYSQGAMAVHVSENSLPKNVKALVLISDGFRTKSDKAKVLGKASKRSNGLAVGRIDGPRRLDGSPKAIHVCVKGDIVCDSTAGFVDSTIHTKGYLNSKLQNKVVKKLFKML